MSFYSVKAVGTVAFSAIHGYTNGDGQTQYSISINQTNQQAEDYKAAIKEIVSKMPIDPEDKKFAFDYLTRVVREANPEKTSLPLTSYFNVSKTFKLYEDSTKKSFNAEKELNTDLPVTLNIVFSDEIASYMNNKYLKGFRTNGALSDKFEYYETHSAFDGFDEQTADSGDELNPFAASGKTKIEISDDDLPF